MIWRIGAATASGMARNLSASGTASRMNAPDHRPGQPLRAAQDHQRGDEDGFLQREAGRVDVGDVVGVEAAGQRAQRRGDGGDQDLHPHHVLAGGLRGDLVLADRAQRAAERGVREPMADRVRERRQSQPPAPRT